MAICISPVIFYISDFSNVIFQRRYARALQGTGRISIKGNFTRGTRYSVLGAISIEGVKASQVITGAYDRDQFEFAMEHFILPLIGSAARNEPC